MPKLRQPRVVSEILSGILPGPTLLGNRRSQTLAGPPVTPHGMGVVFAGMILFGLVAHVLKVNALVGGFLRGLILPESRRLRDAVTGKVRDVAMIFLLPVFFPSPDSRPT
ncbi:MAG: hypothetical protein ABI679_14115 [Gemmatimonadota bacterium]